MAIAAFIAADILLGVMIYLTSEDDPSSPNYVPEDWKHLVLATLGVATPVVTPASFVGEWEEAAGGAIVLNQRGHFSSREYFPNTTDVKTHTTGTVFAFDGTHLVTKVTATERRRITKQPTKAADGSWTMEVDGKTYTKKKPAHSGQL